MKWPFALVVPECDLVPVPSIAINRAVAVEIWRLRAEKGLFMWQIACLLGCDQGRICEVLKGQRFPDLYLEKRGKHPKKRIIQMDDLFDDARP